MKNLKPIRWLMIGAILLLFLSIIDPVFAVSVIIGHVLVGWASFIVKVAPKIAIYWPRLVSGLVYVVVFGIGAHFFCRWLYRELHAGSGCWRGRWTLCGLLLMLLMFTAGVGGVGAVHQILFLRNTEMYEYWRVAEFRYADASQLLQWCKNEWDMVLADGRARQTVYHYTGFRYGAPDYLLNAVIDGPEGHPAAVLLMPRDPARQKQYGLAVATTTGVRMEPIEKLSEIIGTHCDNKPIVTTKP